MLGRDTCEAAESTNYHCRQTYIVRSMLGENCSVHGGERDQESVLKSAGQYAKRDSVFEIQRTVHTAEVCLTKEGCIRKQL
jgi:hypothetical protein